MKRSRKRAQIPLGVALLLALVLVATGRLPIGTAPAAPTAALVTATPAQAAGSFSSPALVRGVTMAVLLEITRAAATS